MIREEGNSQPPFICTFGKLFPDGGIEVLNGHKLVIWNETGEQVSSNLQLDGSNYVAAPLVPSLVAAMRFPATTDDFGSIEALVSELKQALAAVASLEEDALLLLAVYVLSTWTADCLPTPPLLNLWGGVGVENSLVQTLECLCRRPLVVSDVSVRDLCDLPSGLSPTLIVRQPSLRCQQQMLAAANLPEMTLFRGGTLVSFRHAGVLCTRAPLPAPTLSVPLLPIAAYKRMSQLESQQLTARFAPRLLRYRLVQHPAITASTFDCPTFAAETRILARVLGAAVEGSPQLQARIAKALSAIDEECKAAHSQQPAAVVLEALLVWCHEDHPSSPLVQEVTDMVNAIQQGRHHNRELSAKEVGGILRNNLGVKTKRQGAGYRAEVGEAAGLRIHRQAAACGVLSLAKRVDGCLHCAAVIADDECEALAEVHGAQPTEQQKGEEVHDVHNVHPTLCERVGGEVHNVQEVHEVRDAVIREAK